MENRVSTSLHSREIETKRWYQFIPRKNRRFIRHYYNSYRWIPSLFRALPDFYILGGMKCGTSFLFHHICQHPNVVAPVKKEIQYFNTNYDMGELFYRSHFPFKSALKAKEQKEDRLITGEATPDYIFVPSVAERCKKLTPDAKFIVLLREPTSRAYSHYKQGLKFGWEPLSFEKAVELEPRRLKGEVEKMSADPLYYSYRREMYSYLARGRYAEQIEEWLKFFDISQFMFISSEQLFADSKNVYAETLDFLRLPLWTPEKFEHIFPGRPGEITDTTKEQLLNYYRPHNERLYQLLGREFDWGKPTTGKQG